jgi:hypothetical protein
MGWKNAVGSGTVDTLIVVDPLCRSLANAEAHREPPRRALSISPDPQRGGDAVQRRVRTLYGQYSSRLVLRFGRAFPSITICLQQVEP